MNNLISITLAALAIIMLLSIYAAYTDNKPVKPELNKVQWQCVEYKKCSEVCVTYSLIEE